MSLADIHIKNEYRSLLDNVVTDFYIPVLQESILTKEPWVFSPPLPSLQYQKALRD